MFFYRLCIARLVQCHIQLWRSVTTLISVLDHKGVLGNGPADAGVKSEATATSVVPFTNPQKAHRYATNQPFTQLNRALQRCRTFVVNYNQCRFFVNNFKGSSTLKKSHTTKCFPDPPRRATWRMCLAHLTTGGGLSWCKVIRLFE